jgi:hypothetical protein
VARGGYGSSGIPLHERVRGTPPGPPPADPRPTPPTACPARHCWIALPVDGSHPRPGLLLEWRRGELGRWEGRVVYAAELRPGRWSLVEEWVPAELLSAPDPG